MIILGVFPRPYYAPTIEQRELYLMLLTDAFTEQFIGMNFVLRNSFTIKAQYERTEELIRLQALNAFNNQVTLIASKGNPCL